MAGNTMLTQAIYLADWTRTEWYNQTKWKWKWNNPEI